MAGTEKGGTEAVIGEIVAIDRPAFEYTHIFSEPFTFMGKTHNELHFDWGTLKGRDSLAIESELQALGVTVVMPAFSGHYLCRMAARACREKIGSDAFPLMALHDFIRITGAAKSFLLLRG